MLMMSGLSVSRISSGEPPRFCLVHEVQIAEQPVHHERDREHQVLVLLAGGREEGVERVRDDGCRRDGREHRIDQRSRVVRERGSMIARVALEKRQLVATLRQPEEEGKQGRAVVEPRRAGDADNHGPGVHPQHETGGDRHDVEQDLVLEPERVERLQREVAGRDQAERPTERERADERD
jgi:hypothetical protein